MPANDLKKLDQRLFDEAWNAGKLDVVNELIASGAKFHDPGNPNIGSGPDGLKQLISLYRGAFPDIHFTIEAQVADGDLIVTQWRVRGTHKGVLMGVPPTNRVVEITGMSLTRYAQGKGVESWTNWDTLSLLQQIGALPTLGASTPSVHAQPTQQ